VINRRLCVSLLRLLLVLCLSPISAAQAGICNSQCYSCASAGDLGIGPFNGGNGIPPWVQLLQLNDAFGLGGSFTVFLIRNASCAATSPTQCPASPGSASASPVILGPTIPFGGKPICLATWKYLHSAIGGPSA
jgi:hypothetical protein